MSFTLNRLKSDGTDASVILTAFPVNLLDVCGVLLLYFEESHGNNKKYTQKRSTVVFPFRSSALITLDNPQTSLSTYERCWKSVLCIIQSTGCISGQMHCFSFNFSM